MSRRRVRVMISAHALNQYLASRGFIVLAVNYRSGIGYGDGQWPLRGTVRLVRCPTQRLNYTGASRRRL